MTKVALVVWDPQRRPRSARRTLLVEDAGGAVLALGVRGLTVDVADEDAAVRSPTPFPLGAERPIGFVSVWLDEDATIPAVLAVFPPLGLRVAAYRVEGSIPTDYGDNAHAARRDWPDGVRSPGVLTVNFLERPRRRPREAWIRHWHEQMGPVSGRLQPRTRYVRNLVTEALTPDAPPWEGLVEEGWPSRETVADPRRFYGATGLWQQLRHQLAIVRVVTGFVAITRVMTVPMSEYLLRTPVPGDARPTGP